MTDNIVNIGKPFKKKPSDIKRMLTEVPRFENKCREHAYLIDAESDVVTCQNCDKTFNPMAVLIKLCRKEGWFLANARRYEKEMQRLSERKRTKCKSCGNMTNISGN